MQSGCAHILSPPRVQLDGDRAEAINHSIVLVKRGETWVAERVSANRWELGRTTAGWRVVKRTNRLLKYCTLAAACASSAVEPAEGGLAGLVEPH